MKIESERNKRASSTLTVSSMKSRNSAKRDVKLNNVANGGGSIMS